MKIVTDIQKPDEEEEVREIPKSKIFITSVRPQKGQFVWQFDMNTRKLEIITPYETTVNLNGSVKRKIDYKKGCLYAVAINKENAAKKVMKLLDNLENLKQ